MEAMDVALLVLRATVGAVLLAHGWNHLDSLEGTAQWFADLGMRPGRMHAWLASVTEIGAGALLLLGLLTPLAGAGVVGTMLVAWIANHLGNGFFIFRPGEGWEYVMVLTVTGFALAVLGPGAISLDAALGWERLAGWTGLWIALGAGGGGAAALLAGFWRPDTPVE